MRHKKLQHCASSARDHGIQKGRVSSTGKPVGRQKGTPNRVTTVLKDAILAAAELEGDVSLQDGEAAKMFAETDGETAKRGGLVGYLRWLAREEPTAYAGLLAKVIPTQVKVEAFTETVYSSVEQVREDMIKDGVSLESVKAVLEDVEYLELPAFEGSGTNDVTTN